MQILQAPESLKSLFIYMKESKQMNANKKILVLILVVTVIVQIALPSPAYATGTVGTGTPISCNEAALNAALMGEVPLILTVVGVQ